MSELVVRGHWDVESEIIYPWVDGQVEAPNVPVTVLPHDAETGAVGPIEPWMVAWLHAKDAGAASSYPASAWIALPEWARKQFNSGAEVDRYIAAALSKILGDER